MVKISKPYFHLNKEARGFENLMGETGSIMYSNSRGSMVKLDKKNLEVFVPKDAIEKIKNK